MYLDLKFVQKKYKLLRTFLMNARENYPPLQIIFFAAFKEVEIPKALDLKMIWIYFTEIWTMTDDLSLK